MPDAPVVLAVCLGNICRSPTAEAALREAAEDAGVEVTIRSAGTGDWHVGKPPDERMRQAAAEQGLHLSGTADRVTPDDLAAADLVLAMDRANLADLEDIAGRVGLAPPLHLFREFDPDADGDLDVPDPYYGGPDGFVEVVRMVRRTAPRIIDHLRATSAT
jgi:protein-tyrosine phosphatase